MSSCQRAPTSRLLLPLVVDCRPVQEVSSTPPTFSPTTPSLSAASVASEWLRFSPPPRLVPRLLLSLTSTRSVSSWCVLCSGPEDEG